ncbi:MAG: hypothetical protein ACRCY9_12665, partial [Phycicoccus sp.]
PPCSRADHSADPDQHHPQTSSVGGVGQDQQSDREQGGCSVGEVWMVSVEWGGKRFRRVEWMVKEISRVKVMCLVGWQAAWKMVVPMRDVRVGFGAVVDGCA